MALGTAKAVRSVTLYPQVTGMVTEILFKPGQAVEADAPLLTLDDEEEQVAADRARIEYAQARAAFERSQALAKSKTISSVALSDAEMAAQLAENGVRHGGDRREPPHRARALRRRRRPDRHLDRRSRHQHHGDHDARRSLDRARRLRGAGALGGPHRRRSADHRDARRRCPGSKFSGTITGIDNRVDETTRTLRLQADLANFGGLLKTGMAITVSLEFDPDQELVVPSLAVQWDRRGSFVWKVVDGAARRADVAIIRRQSGIVVVKGDVAAGDRVVVEGLLRLREGAKVTEVDETPTIVEETPLRAGASPADEGVPAASGAGRAGEHAELTRWQGISKTRGCGSPRRPRAFRRSRCAARCSRSSPIS